MTVQSCQNIAWITNYQFNKMLTSPQRDIMTFTAVKLKVCTEKLPQHHTLQYKVQYSSESRSDCRTECCEWMSKVFQSQRSDVSRDSSTHSVYTESTWPTLIYELRNLKHCDKIINIDVEESPCRTDSLPSRLFYIGDETYGGISNPTESASDPQL